MEEVLVSLFKYISLPIATFIFGCYVVYINPEKAQIWASYIYRVLSILNKKYRVYATTNDIEGRINHFAKNLSTQVIEHEPVGVKIVYVDADTTKEQFFENNELIIKMYDSGNNNKNFVYATMAFISTTTLPRAKKYISKSQRESIDLFIAKKLFEEEKPQVAEQFFQDFFSPKLESGEKISELIETYTVIDKAGLFFPIFINELVYLGQKVFFKKKAENIIAEVTSLISFLRQRSLRTVGDETAQSVFQGIYCSCAVVLVGKRLKRLSKDSRLYMNYIKKLVNRKVDSIYLIGPTEEGNNQFISDIGKGIEDTFNYYKTYEKQCKATIRGNDAKLVSTENYLVLYRNPNVTNIIDGIYYTENIEPYSKDDSIIGLSE